MTFEAAHKAIKRGDAEALQSALANGLDPNLSNKNGATLLMLAAIKGNTQIGRLLVAAGADLDRRDKWRGTALSDAVLAGSTGFVKLLLAKGASLDCHPHGNSLDTYLDWVESFYPEQMKNIRKAFEAERAARANNSKSLEP